MRPHDRELTVTLTLTRGVGFPADGLNLIRNAIAAVVNNYDIGEQVWANDILSVAEAVGGTRVTSISVEYNSTNASGVAVPLDIVWTLPTANLSITIT